MRVGQLCALERIRADQLRQPVSLVRRGRYNRSHLMKSYVEAARGELPGGLRSGKASPHNGDGKIVLPLPPPPPPASRFPLHTATASGVGATSHSFAHLMQRR